MLPMLRTKLRGVSSKNKSLQDILRSCNDSKEVLSVSASSGGIHNTKVILLIDQGKDLTPQDRYVKRAHFYTRLDLADIMSDIVIESKDLSDIITELNVLGYDFTEDDLEIVDNILQATATSLGYVGICPVELPLSFEITCDGALAKTGEVWLDGVFDLYVDDVLIGTGTPDELNVLANTQGISFEDVTRNSYEWS